MLCSTVRYQVRRRYIERLVALWSAHYCLFFFFSSRRRHTRSYGDWSSDVCSSDLSLPSIKHHSFTGEDEELEYSGMELAFFFEDNAGNEWCFMDGKLRDDPTTEIPNAKQVKDNANRGEAVDFTLQELCAHFVIPDVPDVATVNPEGYSRLVEMLSDLESTLAT